jgi:hypothetical protein
MSCFACAVLTVLVAAKVVSIHHIESSYFASSESDPVDTGSVENGRIKQTDTTRREIFVASVKLGVANGNKEVLLCELSRRRVNSNISNGLAQGADGNISGMWRSIDPPEITINI